MPLDRTTARSWFRAQRSDDGSAEITIYDEIGAWGIKAKDFHDELRSLGAVSKVYVRINSPGGEVFEALAIHNMLKRHRASVEVTIDGIAASSASLIAVAGDIVRMPGNAMMMVHDPEGVVIGPSRDMREMGDALDKVKQGMIAAYAAKSGQSVDEIATLMEDETWLTADEAVELGFADELVEPVRIAAKFDLARYRNPPIGLTAHRQEEQAMSQRTKGTAATAQQPEQQPNKPGEQQPGEQQPGEQPQQPGEQPQQPEQPEQKPAEPPPPKQPSASATDQAVAAERARAAEIMAACNLVGRHDLAAGFVADGKTVGQVVNALQELRVQGSSGSAGEISTRNAGGAAAQGGPLRVDLVADMRRRAGVKGA